MSTEDLSEEVAGPSRKLTEYERASQRVRAFNEINIDDAILFMECIDDGTILELEDESDDDDSFGIQSQGVSKNEEELLLESEISPNIEVEVYDEDIDNHL